MISKQRVVVILSGVEGWLQLDRHVSTPLNMTHFLL